MSTGTAVQAILEGMPTPQHLHASESGGQVVISAGATVLFSYAADDTGLRNLAAVTLPAMGFTGRRVAELLGITEVYVSMLRGRARREGSAALVPRRGRPAALGEAGVARARGWRADGDSDAAIGARLGVHATTVARALADVPRPQPADVGPELALVPETAVTDGPAETQPATAEDEAAEDEAAEDEAVEDVGAVEDEALGEVADGDGPVPVSAGSARIKAGFFRSRYAGAMLLHPYLHRVDAEAIFTTLTGGPARRYDDLSVLSTVALGFALGTGTVEGAKHLRRSEAGPAVGVNVVPELATLRARLAALADGTDPLALQRAFATGMLAADPVGDPVYFVDDHFKPYAGARPVGKGWNTKRRHAEAGIDDTMVVDARGRAVVFGTGEPSSLAATLPGVLTQLRDVIGTDAPVMLAFDRGGAFPAAFSACRDDGADWVTYRRRPLAAVTATPRRSWTVREGRRVIVRLADETVEVKGYGAARQLTLFEAGQPVLQVLTSDTTSTGADLLCWLRSRWRIENMFKYAAAHNGIDALADYRMDIGPDPRTVVNPDRVAARQQVKAAEADLAVAERDLPQMLDGPGAPAQINAKLPGVHRRIETARTRLAEAKARLKPIPAKVAVTDLDPDAKRARPRIERRGLQMVLRLLAFNAEAWLADHLNAYLTDPDEYRAITSNLLHTGGDIEYTPKAITITLDRPDTPRIARGLELLIDELNAAPARLPGDSRPLNYQISSS